MTETNPEGKFGILSMAWAPAVTGPSSFSLLSRGTGSPAVAPRVLTERDLWSTHSRTGADFAHPHRLAPLWRWRSRLHARDASVRTIERSEARFRYETRSFVFGDSAVYGLCSLQRRAIRQTR